MQRHSKYHTEAAIRGLSAARAVLDGVAPAPPCPPPLVVELAPVLVEQLEDEPPPQPDDPWSARKDIG